MKVSLQLSSKFTTMVCLPFMTFTFNFNSPSLLHNEHFFHEVY